MIIKYINLIIDYLINLIYFIFRGLQFLIYLNLNIKQLHL